MVVASKAERGYRLFRDEAPRPFKAKPPSLTAGMTPVEAFRGIALRRLRSAIKLFPPILPPEFVATYGRT